MLQKGFFLTESHNPDLPEEEWTLVEQITSAGAYSTNIGWGKYKIEVSGAGGGGAAAGWSEASGTRYANAGSAGEQITIYIDVLSDETKTLSGIVGAGGTGGRADWDSDGSSHNSGGAGGTGYQNGTNGTNQRHLSVFEPDEGAATSGGGGGASTSLAIDGVITNIAKGGNGGTARFSKFSIWGYGGTGGNGGVSSGSGAQGGAGDGAYSTSTRVGGTGSTGYIRIYKSNLKPEPV